MRSQSTLVVAPSALRDGLMLRDEEGGTPLTERSAPLDPHERAHVEQMLREYRAFWREGFEIQPLLRQRAAAHPLRARPGHEGLVMRAAIYARRSTEHQEASIPVQLEEARGYIALNGWALVEEHVYVDDALSRAEYKKRPQLYAMLNEAEKRDRGFDVIVLRDVDRLGGIRTETA